MPMIVPDCSRRANMASKHSRCCQIEKPFRDYFISQIDVDSRYFLLLLPFLLLFQSHRRRLWVTLNDNCDRTIVRQIHVHRMQSTRSRSFLLLLPFLFLFQSHRRWLWVTLNDNCDRTIVRQIHVHHLPESAIVDLGFIIAFSEQL